MNLAIITPMLSAVRFGYGNTFYPCIASQAEFADHVFLMQSSDDPRNLDGLSLFDNVTLVSTPFTWSHDGRYDGRRINRNIALGCAMAIQTGCNAALVMTSNAYIPRPNMEALRDIAADMLKRRTAFEYVPRANLIAGHLTRVSKRLPYLVNLEYYPSACISWTPDGCWHDGILYPPEYVTDATETNYCFVDVQYELTWTGHAEKAKYVGGYGRPATYDWRSYHTGKVARMIPSTLPLDVYGGEIAANTQPEYIGADLWRSTHGGDA